MENGYREHRLHGTQQFPCAYYDTSNLRQEGSYEVPYHWHDEIELMFLRQGKYRLEINMVQYELEAPCLCMINSSELHSLTSLSQQYMESAIVFHPRLLSFQEPDQMQEQIIDALIGKQLLLPRFLFPSYPAWDRVYQEYQEMEEAFQKESTCTGADQFRADQAVTQLAIKASLLKILACLQREGLLEVPKTKEDVKVLYIKSALSYIQQNYRDKIYIRDLAGEVGLNEQYFCRLFRRVMRMSPVEYMNSYRIHKALAMLEQTSLPVTEIAYECGFHDMGGFIREFRKLTETTPLQYRKRFERKG